MKHLVDTTQSWRCFHSYYNHCRDSTWEYVAPDFVPAGTVIHDYDMTPPCASFGQNGPTVDGCVTGFADTQQVANKLGGQFGTTGDQLLVFQTGALAPADCAPVCPSP